MSAVFPILWLTGNSGAGKTTLAYGVKRYFDEEESEKLLYRKVVILDGDEMRASISTTETLSPADRRAATFAWPALPPFYNPKDFSSSFRLSHLYFRPGRD